MAEISPSPRPPQSDGETVSLRHGVKGVTSVEDVLVALATPLHV